MSIEAKMTTTSNGTSLSGRLQRIKQQQQHPPLTSYHRASTAAKSNNNKQTSLTTAANAAVVSSSSSNPSFANRWKGLPTTALGIAVEQPSTTTEPTPSSISSSASSSAQFMAERWARRANSLGIGERLYHTSMSHSNSSTTTVSNQKNYNLPMAQSLSSPPQDPSAFPKKTPWKGPTQKTYTTSTIIEGKPQRWKTGTTTTTNHNNKTALSWDKPKSSLLLSSGSPEKTSENKATTTKQSPLPEPNDQQQQEEQDLIANRWKRFGQAVPTPKQQQQRNVLKAATEVEQQQEEQPEKHVVDGIIHQETNHHARLSFSSTASSPVMMMTSPAATNVSTTVSPAATVASSSASSSFWGSSSRTYVATTTDATTTTTTTARWKKPTTTTSMNAKNQNSNTPKATTTSASSSSSWITNESSPSTSSTRMTMTTKTTTLETETPTGSATNYKVDEQPQPPEEEEESELAASPSKRNIFKSMERVNAKKVPGSVMPPLAKKSWKPKSQPTTTTNPQTKNAIPPMFSKTLPSNHSEPKSSVLPIATTNKEIRTMSEPSSSQPPSHGNNAAVTRKVKRTAPASSWIKPSNNNETNRATEEKEEDYNDDNIPDIVKAKSCPDPSRHHHHHPVVSSRFPRNNKADPDYDVVDEEEPTGNEIVETKSFSVMESRKRFGGGGGEVHNNHTTTTTTSHHWNAFRSRTEERFTNSSIATKKKMSSIIITETTDESQKMAPDDATEFVAMEDPKNHDSQKEVKEVMAPATEPAEGMPFSEETAAPKKASSIEDMKAKLWGSGSGGKLIVSQPNHATQQQQSAWVDISSSAPSVVTVENGSNVESPEQSLVQSELFTSPERAVRGQPDVSTPYGPSLPERDLEPIPSMAVAPVPEQKPILESFDGNATVFQSDDSFVVDPPRPKQSYVVSPPKSESWVARRMKSLPPSPHLGGKSWPKLQVKKEERQRDLKVDTSVAHEPKRPAAALIHYRSPSVGDFQLSNGQPSDTSVDVESPAETRPTSTVEKPLVLRSPSMGDSPIETAKGLSGEETTMVPEEFPSSLSPHSTENAAPVEEASTPPKQLSSPPPPPQPPRISDINQEEKDHESSPTAIIPEKKSPTKVPTTNHPSVASLTLPPISPREKVRPWNKDVNILSPKSWQKRSMDIDALSITSPSAPVRRLTTDSQDEKQSFEERFMAVQKSPSSLGQLAAQSIHAIDFEKTVRSIPKRTLSEETDGSVNSTENEGSAIPASVPPEFSLAVSETLDKKAQRERPTEESKDESPIIFGHEKLIAKVDSDRGTTKPIHVPDMAKALTNWNGGLGVIAPKINKQEIYRREITRESSPLRRTKSEESEFSDVIFSGFKKRGVAIEDWQRTKSFDSDCRRSQHDNAHSSDFWMPAKLDDSVADENEWARGAKKNVENKLVDENKSPARDPFEAGHILQDVHALNMENNAEDACDWSGRDPEIIISPSSASDAVTHASEKKSISSFALGLSKRDTSTTRRKSSGRKSTTDKVMKNLSIAKKSEPIFDPWGVDGTTQGDFTETTADPTDSTDFFGFDPFGASDFCIKEYMPKPIEEDLRHEDHQGYFPNDISKQAKHSEGSVASLNLNGSEASAPLNDESSFWSYDADTSTVQLEI